MAFPSWKTFLQSSLKENIEKSGLSATYASIATVRSNNTPAVRTVVMRGFVGEHHSESVGWNSDLLVVITDKRSDKIKEMQQNPNTEINWYELSHNVVILHTLMLLYTTRFMNGTMEQFRIRGTIDIIGKDYDESKLEHLDSHIKQTESPSDNDQKSLGLQMFLKQSATNKFSWQGERLRHFYQFGSKMRKEMTESKEKDLDIDQIDEKTGWFKSTHAQDLLEEAFDNFVLLVIHVTSVRHWSPSTGTKSML